MKQTATVKQRQQWQTAAELAKACGCSSNTVRRYAATGRSYNGRTFEQRNRHAGDPVGVEYMFRAFDVWSFELDEKGPAPVTVETKLQRSPEDSRQLTLVGSMDLDRAARRVLDHISEELWESDHPSQLIAVGRYLRGLLK